jgi:glycosyltransferase involved in cell wall biosynthesis
VAESREEFIRRGIERWKGSRLLIALPVSERSGGANVVLDEAAAMRRMGVEVTIANLSRHQRAFEGNYRDNSVPVVYIRKPREFAKMLSYNDAAIATWCASVDWLDTDARASQSMVRAYYIQDFEPHFFYEGSSEFEMAMRSYTRYPDLVRFTKTEWNRNTVRERAGVDCAVVGPSVNIDLYKPVARRELHWPEAPLSIAAMIRPSTAHRAPQFTLEVLREFYRRNVGAVELKLFGCDSSDLRSLGVPNDFSYHNSGGLTRHQIASLMNEVDIFADFSTYQAMGLTAMEAMCCGAAVIVPERGGAASFVRQYENGVIVDTSSRDACLSALEELANDEMLRTRLQARAALDVCHFHPERAAYNILNTVFPERRRAEPEWQAISDASAGPVQEASSS